MNAIILAAGMGTRLRPLTDDIPKCLVEVNGIPMVERQILLLQERGIFDITLVAGYRKDKLEYLVFENMPEIKHCFSTRYGGVSEGAFSYCLE